MCAPYSYLWVVCGIDETSAFLITLSAVIPAAIRTNLMQWSGSTCQGYDLVTKVQNPFCLGPMGHVTMRTDPVWETGLFDKPGCTRLEQCMRGSRSNKNNLWASFSDNTLTECESARWKFSPLYARKSMSSFQVCQWPTIDNRWIEEPTHSRCRVTRKHLFVPCEWLKGLADFMGDI